MYYAIEKLKKKLRRTKLGYSYKNKKLIKRTEFDYERIHKA